MRKYLVTVPGHTPFHVEAVPSLAAAVAALTLELDTLPAGSRLVLA